MLIAPYWADADTRGIGTVYYRSTTDEALLSRMTQDVGDSFSGVTFTPQYLFIATWFEIGYFSNHTDKVPL